jgi:hypothetical protein
LGRHAAILTLVVGGLLLTPGAAGTAPDVPGDPTRPRLADHLGHARLEWLVRHHRHRQLEHRRSRVDHPVDRRLRRSDAQR